MGYLYQLELCPHCSEDIKVENSEIGDIVECKGCGGRYIFSESWDSEDRSYYPYLEELL